MKEPIKGKEYLCIKTVVMGSGYTAYIKGKVYISERNGCITNEKNNANHIWTKEGINECFTKTEETFEITKETIIKYKMKDEFPEVFEVKLEAGKWYKYFGNLCIYNGETKTYGFWNKEFRNDISFGPFDFEDNDILKATEQEVFEALENEAIRRGYEKENIFLEIFKGLCNIEFNNYSESYYYAHSSNILYFKGKPIFSKGTWAEITPTKTKEEAEKLLNCKIV